MEWALFVLVRLYDVLRQPQADGCDFVIGQVFMPGHIGSGDSEFDDLCQAIPALGSRNCRLEI
jgi:hypothetical protein